MANRVYLAHMKESYHICFTSHEEVMFRDEEDHGVFVNLMALRAFSMPPTICDWRSSACALFAAT